MTTLDALRTQIDLLQYHRGDRDRLSRLRAKPPVARKVGGFAIDQSEDLFAHPDKVDDYIFTSRLAVLSLENAQTVYVADWVVDTLEDAVNSFPLEYEPRVTDMPFDNGFALLGRQINLATRPAFSLDIQAVSWHRRGSEVLVAIYGFSRDANLPAEWHQSIEIKSCYALHLGGGTIHEQASDRHPRYTDKWYQVDGDRIVQHELDADIVTGLSEAETRWAFSFVASLWLFMSDRIVQSETTMAPRAFRRNMQRDGLTMEPKVQTIVLRAVERPEGWEERPHRDYQVRWVVRGHWAKRWVGKVGSAERRLEPRWISAYIKGPEDAPLSTPIKLFAVSR